MTNSALQDPAYVEEYLEMPREEIPAWQPGEAAKGDFWYSEMDFDMDPTRGVNKHKKSDHVHGMCLSSMSPDAQEIGNRCCIPGCTNPITRLSNYGFMDWSNFDVDEDWPEVAGLCWEHARLMFYAEMDLADPKTGMKPTEYWDEDEGKVKSLPPKDRPDFEVSWVHPCLLPEAD